MHSLEEAGCGLRRRCTTNGKLQAVVCLRVVQLDGLDPTQIKVVTRKLGITHGHRERGLRHKLVSLVEKIIVEVVSQELCDKDSLTFVIPSKRSRPLCR